VLCDETALWDGPNGSVSEAGMVAALEQEAAEFGVPINMAPMEARSAVELPEGNCWQYEPNGMGFAA
jgi:hypothetical protein